MAWSFGRIARRRIAALLTCVLLAVGTVAISAAGSEAGAAPPAADGPQPASRDTVLQALSVSNVRAEIVILVDISLSMAPGQDDLYPVVRQQVLNYLGVLAQQDPQDLVGVILFGKRGDNQLTGPGSPDPHTWLPEKPYSDETDFGWAFQQAVQMLQAAPKDIKAGGVLLLSDGELSVAPGDDPTYGTGFTARGWKQLRTQVQSLRMPVTGYDVPLTDNTTYTSNQYQALTQVFWPVQSLPAGTANLSQALGLATQGVLNSEVARAAAPDSGLGVRFAWSGLQGADGKPLDLRTGQAEVTVTATATTRKIPVYLSGLSVASTGLPVAMKGTASGGCTITPGQSAHWRVRLRWYPTRSGWTKTGDPRTVNGQLRLAAKVSSPFSPTLRSAFGDTAFPLGAYQISLSPRFRASEPAYNILLGLLGLLGLMVLLFAVARARLSGTLTVTAAEGPPHPLRLRGWWLFQSTAGLAERRGRLLVHGSPVRRVMKVHLWISGRRPFHQNLRRGEALLPAGIEVAHDPHRFRPAEAEQAAGAPTGRADVQQEDDGQET